MGFKKIKEGEEMLWRIEGKDIDGRITEKWKFMHSDFLSVIKILLKKYGYNLIIKKKDYDRDLDWAK